MNLVKKFGRKNLFIVTYFAFFCKALSIQSFLKMTKITMEEIRQMMDNQDNIRNMSVIAYADHGKSTLSDCLINKAGIITQESTENKNIETEENLHDRTPEKGTMIKSTNASLFYKYNISPSDKKQEQEYLINLIDSPGHVDFSSEVTAALRISDGALLVTDPLEHFKTESLLRHAMQEKIRPILMVNKLDQLILQYKLDGQVMYQNFSRALDFANVVISTYQSEDMGEAIFQPALGNVAFGSGKDQWAFTLSKFARIYSKKFGISEDKMMRKLWGDNFFDAPGMKWRICAENGDGKPLRRAFSQFIMDPICKLCQSIMEGNREQYEKMLKTLEIELTEQQKQLPNKQILKTIMSRWLPAADALLQMIVLHLPSPKTAQKYTTSYLYKGSLDDAAAEGMKTCDPKAPLMIYISKMVPTADKGRFYAFGRVFSGTAASGQKVRIMGPNYTPGKKEDLYEKNISRTVLLMGRNVVPMSDVPCGNIVALAGIDQYLIKTATIGCIDHPESHPIRSMKYSVSPIVKVAIQPKNHVELPQLIEGVKKLSKSDPLVVSFFEETGENIIAGSGQLHVEFCLDQLTKNYAQCQIIRSDLIVTYKEAITSHSSVDSMAKSPNKHNRLYGSSEPLDEDLQNLIEAGEIGPSLDPKVRGKRLVDEFDWYREDTQKIWAFAPEHVGPNMLVDITRGLQYMNELKQHMVSAFQWSSKQGVLCDESVRGMRVNITDCVYVADAIHRGGGQIIPTARRLYYALELLSEPTLLEPIYTCDIMAPKECLGGVYETLHLRRGEVQDEVSIEDTPFKLVKAYLPVAESFGFSALLGANTQGKANSQCVFDHWQQIKGFPLKDQKAADLVLSIRKRKGLKDYIPPLENFKDKL